MSQKETSQKLKSKVFLTIFFVTAAFLAWGVWNNYRPVVIYASCSDIAYKTASISKRSDIVDHTEDQFNNLLGSCLSDAGYYK